MNATPAFSDQASEPPSPLLEKIQEQIRVNGPLSFCEYMATALYDPDHGYYSAKKQRVGKQGDFITSVSVGHCFGMILARRLHAFWTKSGKAEGFHIIEPGAHDGTLCSDILGEIRQLDPAFYQTVHYHLIEATPSLMETHRHKLTDQFSGKFTSHKTLAQIKGLHGAFVSNELIDAFPVELIRFNQGQWHQFVVTLAENQSLRLTPQEINNPELKAFCDKLGQAFPDGYTTEYNPGIAPFTRDAANALSSGLFITIDYGHSTEDYYHPDRVTGTLQTYYQHQKAEDPFVSPGNLDITSHIDFTRLVTTAETHGFRNPSLRTQASYLTDHARSWLLEIEDPSIPNSPDTPSLLRQFQTLIHPAMLGTKFSVLEMQK